MMNLLVRTTSAGRFWLIATAALFSSFGVLLTNTGGYSLIILVFYLGPFYLLSWLLFTAASIATHHVRYSPLFLYILLAFFSLVFLFNIADSGYYGITCDTKNWIQYWFDRSPGCSKLWMSSESHFWLRNCYGLLLFVFAVDVLRRRAAQA
jgi:hypothetical protein